jgi:Secretion system C-terminal sorting domain
MMYKYKFFGCLMCLSTAITTNAQGIAPATQNVAGGTVTFGSTVIDWSVGEMSAVNTALSNAVIVTQGVLQPVKIIKAGIEAESICAEFSVFPNPTKNEINVAGKYVIGANLSYLLMDSRGSVVKTGTIYQAAPHYNCRISLSGVSAGEYFLNIKTENNFGSFVNKVYKVEKTN